MAEFRVGRLLLRTAEHAEATVEPFDAELGDLEDDVAVALDDPMSMRELALFLETDAEDADHLRQALHEQLLAGHIVIEREPARTLDAQAGPSSATLADLATDPRALADEHYTVEIQLIGEDDAPVSGVRFSLELPGGRVIEGRTGADGHAAVWGIAREGECRVSFPDLDTDAWEAVDATPLD